MRYLFLTGKLAAPALEEVARPLAARLGFSYRIEALGISVAALLTPRWVATHLAKPEGIDRVMVPGACTGDWAELQAALGLPVEVGPADLRDLPEHFGEPRALDYGAADIEIIAEINHAPRLNPDDLLKAARRFRDEGADVIDLGCVPGEPWPQLSAAVRRLREEGLRISIDSFDPEEAAAGAKAGAELIFSVNGTNRHLAPDWGCEVVAIPDPHPNPPPSTGEGATHDWMESLTDTVEFLSKHGVKHRLDPILEPIGFGFAASLGRYLETRRRFPQHEVLMGVGNLTELTEVDSAGVNVLLAGFCQELGIRSVLTTAVANWSKSSVRELALARKLVHHAVKQGVVPKKLEPGLNLLRARKLKPRGEAELNRLAADLTDPNLRLFAEEGQLHVMNGAMHLAGAEPFKLFAELFARQPVTPDHAFYLGYELAKATTALTLGKNYVQDQALDWGFLTRPETSHRQASRERQRPEGTS